MILIGLGANMPSAAGGPADTLHAALAKMPEHGITVKRASPFYKSAPVPESDQPWFINAVAEIETKLTPQELMRVLLEIEKSFGRKRERKNDPRSLDLDILDYNGRVNREGDLELPHPRLGERTFVLYPLRDIAPGWKHPVSGVTVTALIKQLAPQKIQKN